MWDIQEQYDPFASPDRKGIQNNVINMLPWEGPAA